MNNYTFSNKFIIENKSYKHKTRTIVLIVLLVLFMIITIPLIGFSPTRIYPSLLLIGLLLTKLKPEFIVEAATRVEFDNEKLTIYYMNLNRQDKLGVRNESYIIFPNMIKDIFYDDVRFELHILSKPLVKVTPKKKNVIEKDYRESNEWFENTLYLTDEVRESILQMLNSICKIKPMPAEFGFNIK